MAAGIEPGLCCGKPGAEKCAEDKEGFSHRKRPDIKPTILVDRLIR
jgi:hypothetical protein